MYWRYFRVSPHRVNADPLSSRGENEEEKRRSMTLIDFINATNLHCAERSEIVRIFNEARAKRASQTNWVG